MKKQSGIQAILLVEEINKSGIASPLKIKALREALKNTPAIDIPSIIHLDIILGKACLPELNEWAREKMLDLTEEQFHAVKTVLSLLPEENYYKKYIKK